jgi:molybdate transport system substrate-binding protein
MIPALLTAAMAISGTGRARTPLVVMAAPAMERALRTLAPIFEAAHPGVEVQLALHRSEELPVRIEQGARADVLACADRAAMTALAARALVDSPVVFARNEAVLVVPRGRQSSIAGLGDLRRPRRLAIGVRNIAIGRDAVEIFESAGRRRNLGLRFRLEASVAFREPDARQVLNRLALGEADAGIVHRSDALPARGRLTIFRIPADLNVRTDYPIATVAASVHPDLARAFVALVLSPEGQRLLSDAGFLPGR